MSFHALPRLLPLTLSCLLLAAGCNDGGDDDSADAAPENTPAAPAAAPASTTVKSNPPPATAAKVIDPGFDPALDIADPSTVNLTGTWAWQYSGIYNLRQSGASLQGTYTEPADPGVKGVIAGTVSGARLEMNVMVTFRDHPEDNFTAHKSGQIHGTNTMTLVVTGGPKLVGNVQRWQRR